MMSIDEAIDGLKRIFSNYELGLPRTDSLDIELEIIVLLEELKEYKATLLTPQMIEELKKSEKQAHKTAIQNAMIAEDSYNKALDDIKEKLMQNGFIYTQLALDVFNEIAEQLKAGGMNEYNI